MPRKRDGFVPLGDRHVQIVPVFMLQGHALIGVFPGELVPFPAAQKNAFRRFFQDSGPPTGDTNNAGRDGSITATGNGPTRERGRLRVTDQPSAGPRKS